MKRLALALIFAFGFAPPAWADFQAGIDAYQHGDYAAAYREWLLLAEEGDAEAQFNLGILYDLGQGVAQSKVRAATWYRRSAEQGFAAAQYNLAVMFKNGEGIPQNNVLAYALFDLAAADDPEAAEQRDSMARSIAAEEIDRAVRLADRAREDDTAMFLGEVLGAALPAEPGPESESAGPSPDLVRTVQEALTVLGYDAGAADGMIGPRTRAAIRAFQADTELAVEGRVSQRLLARLEQSMARTSPPRAPDENPAKQQYSSKIDRLLSEKRVAFVSSRGVSPNEFWGRLKATGVELRNFSPTQLQSLVLFKPHIIIVDYDTSRAWRRQPKEVIRGILSNERLIGFGNGGAYLFRILGSGIGLGNAMHSPRNFQVEIPTVPDEVLEAPEIPTIVTVHSPDTSTDAIGVYARGSPAISGFSGIARWVRHGQHWPIARQGNLLLWGFDAPLGTLTKEGKQLLLHLLVDHMHRSFRHYSTLIAKQTFVQPGILEDSLVPQLPSDIWYFRASRTGKIRATLVWDPGTIALALILNGLDGQERVAFARRDGQSPISLEYQVTSSDLARADKWRLGVVRFRNFSVSEISYKLILEFPN